MEICEEARKQWARPLDDFKYNVKCCYNCPHWEKDITLMHEYAYNYCEPCKSMTVWDYVCNHYSGVAKEENLIVSLTKEEREELAK